MSADPVLRCLKYGAKYAQDEDMAAAHRAALDLYVSLRQGLAKLADQHHRTLTGSRLHDPERITDFRDCSCVTCRSAAQLLSEPHSQPCDCVWCRFQDDDAEGAVVHVPQPVCECDAPRCERDGCQDKPTSDGARAAQENQ
jgi:hypothetical protein